MGGICTQFNCTVTQTLSLGYQQMSAMQNEWSDTIKLKLVFGTYFFILEPGQAFCCEDEPEILGAPLDKADIV